MISYAIKKRIVDETNIVEVVGEYVKLHKKGNSHFGLCPFHNDNNPSMSVSNKVKMFNCFSCGAKGNVINFVSRYENITEDQATIKLAERIGIHIDSSAYKQNEKELKLENIMKEAAQFYQFYLKNSIEGNAALAYLKNRGIDEKIIDKFEIGLAPNLTDGLYQFLMKKNYLELDLMELGLISSSSNEKIHDVFRERIMFPIFSSNGKVIGFSGRIYNSSNQAKYINSQDNPLFHKGEILYNLNNAALPAKKNDRIYIFEGFMDVIAAYRANVDYGVATMGTALTKEHIKKLLTITKNIVLCFDGDEAGIHALSRSNKLFAEMGLIPDAVVLPNNLDPDEYLKANGSNLLNTYLVSKAKPAYYWLYELSIKNLNKLDLRSIEEFKRSVFEFISYCRQATVVEYYLKKVSEDLHLDIEVVKEDYKKYNYRYQQLVTSNPMEQEKSEEEKIITKLEVPSKVYRAYEIIIKHCLYDVSRTSKYFETIGDNFLCKELELEFSIMNKIISLIRENPNLINDKDNREVIINDLNKNELIKDYLSKIIDDNKINVNSMEEFEQCLKTIQNFINKLSLLNVKKRVLNNDNTAYEEYIKNKIKCIE